MKTTFRQLALNFACVLIGLLAGAYLTSNLPMLVALILLEALGMVAFFVLSR